MGARLTSAERALLERIVAVGRPVHVRRAGLLLQWDAGLAPVEIGRRVGLSAGRVRYWLRAFREQRLGIFPAKLLDPPRRPGVLPDDLLGEAGRKVLRFHFERMLRHEPGTRLGEDIEELHDMRVATRRMRSAFRVFAPYWDPQTLAPFLKGLRRTGRALGRVRDLDVLMAQARRYLAVIPGDDCPDLDPLLEHWRGQREAARVDMLAYLDRKRYRRFVKRFARFLQSEGAGVLLPPDDEPAAYRVYQVAPALIYARYQAVRGYDALIEGASLEQLHALRIDCKRLRYTLEFFREVLGPEAKRVIKEVVIVQDHLGELNDARVAVHLLGAFLASREEEGERVPAPGVRRYLADRRAELSSLQREFSQTWWYFNRPEMRRRLALAVSVL